MSRSVTTSSFVSLRRCHGKRDASLLAVDADERTLEEPRRRIGLEEVASGIELGRLASHVAEGEHE